jgi:hypothetical protein
MKFEFLDLAVIKLTEEANFAMLPCDPVVVVDDYCAINDLSLNFVSLLFQLISAMLNRMQ